MGSASDITDLPRAGYYAEAGMVIAERYRLDREIGTGGMATVWAATHLTLNQPIALKFIEVAGPRTAALHERFLREARIAAAVRHRNVVDIIDFGTSSDGLPFMAMELLDGRTLAQRMDDAQPIPVHEVVRIMARVLSGLGAVHDAGLVHRDVKPENIFLVEDADGVYPKLLDFGISRSLDRMSEIKSVLPTLENAIVGTPQYMSPEQARGLPSIDHRSDIWSAGVMLFELMTGVLPFDSDAVGDIIIQIATQDPPDFALLRPDLAGSIEEVIKRAMSKDPDDRYRSAREMRTSLLAAVAKTAVDLHAASSYARFESDTFETPQALELLEAVGDAYEPGDSELLDFSEHLDLIESMRPPPPPGPAVPPPAPKTAHDPFATPEIESPEASGVSPRLLAFGALAAMAAIGAVAMLSGLGDDETEAAPVVAPDIPSEPGETPPEGEEPGPPPGPETVTVTLESVPDGVQILVDGATWAGGTEVELPRDGASHTIEARAADGRSWTQDHTADHDGSYTVVLPRQRVIRPRRGGAARRGEGLIRDPGF